MENLFEVHAEARTDEGKGASRRLRRTGKVPAIVYGTGKKPESISLDHNLFIRHLAEEAFYAHILTLVIGKKKHQVVLKDLQRHPANDNKIIHADFLRIDSKHEMTMTVQLHFLNEEDAPGVDVGGQVARLISEVEISCLPKDLPEYIEVDLAKLEMDEYIHLSELKLPEGVVLTALSHPDEELEEGERSTYDQAVVTIHEPRVIEEDDEETDEDEDGEETDGKEEAEDKEESED